MDAFGVSTSKLHESTFKNSLFCLIGPGCDIKRHIFDWIYASYLKYGDNCFVFLFQVLVVIWWPFRLAGFLPTCIYTAFQENCLMNPKVVTIHLELFLVQVGMSGFLHTVFEWLFLHEYRQATFAENMFCLWMLQNFPFLQAKSIFK